LSSIKHIKSTRVGQLVGVFGAREKACQSKKETKLVKSIFNIVVRTKNFGTAFKNP
jgi:hypothetical protein